MLKLFKLYLAHAEDTLDYYTAQRDNFNSSRSNTKAAFNDNLKELSPNARARFKPQQIIYSTTNKPGHIDKRSLTTKGKKERGYIRQENETKQMFDLFALFNITIDCLKTNIKLMNDRLKLFSELNDNFNEAKFEHLLTLILKYHFILWDQRFTTLSKRQDVKLSIYANFYKNEEAYEIRSFIEFTHAYLFMLKDLYARVPSALKDRLENALSYAPMLKSFLDLPDDSTFNYDDFCIDGMIFKQAYPTNQVLFQRGTLAASGNFNSGIKLDLSWLNPLPDVSFYVEAWQEIYSQLAKDFKPENHVRLEDANPILSDISSDDAIADQTPVISKRKKKKRKKKNKAEMANVDLPQGEASIMKMAEQDSDPTPNSCSTAIIDITKIECSKDEENDHRALIDINNEQPKPITKKTRSRKKKNSANLVDTSIPQLAKEITTDEKIQEMALATPPKSSPLAFSDITLQKRSNNFSNHISTDDGRRQTARNKHRNLLASLLENDLPPSTRYTDLTTALSHAFGIVEESRGNGDFRKFICRGKDGVRSIFLYRPAVPQVGHRFLKILREGLQEKMGLTIDNLDDKIAEYTRLNRVH